MDLILRKMDREESDKPDSVTEKVILVKQLTKFGLFVDGEMIISTDLSFLNCIQQSLDYKIPMVDKAEYFLEYIIFRQPPSIQHYSVLMSLFETITSGKIPVPPISYKKFFNHIKEGESSPSTTFAWKFEEIWWKDQIIPLKASKPNQLMFHT